MIDLHCHLVPGLDDGPATLEESLQMARMAVADGITSARTTPHIHVGRFDNDLKSIASAVAALREAIARESIPLELGFAAEVRLDYELIPMIEEGRVPFLGEIDGYKVLLLELPHSHVPVGAETFVDWLLARRIRPMIAHPERNKDILRDARKVEPFVRAGCLIQLTADAVAGAFGPECRHRSRQFLDNGWVTVLASDGHDTVARPPRMSTGRREAARILGDQEAFRLTTETPARIASTVAG